MDQLVKGSSNEHEHLSSDIQELRKKPGMVVSVTLALNSRRFLVLGSLAKSVSSTISRRPCLKN